MASFRVKANNAGTATHMLTTDMAWSRRIAISAGTYNWQEYKRIFDTGNNIITAYHQETLMVHRHS